MPMPLRFGVAHDFRIPDLTMIANQRSEASTFSANQYYGAFQRENLLSDDPYLDTDPIQAGARQVFVPDLAGGRPDGRERARSPQELARSRQSHRGAGKQGARARITHRNAAIPGGRAQRSRSQGR